MRTTKNKCGTSCPLFDELVRRSREEIGNDYLPVSFDHGTVFFWGERYKRRALISLDLWRTRDLLPEVSERLEDQHREYLDQRPDVCRGGAVSHFGPISIRFHVRLEDADEWIAWIFDIVSDPSNLKPAKTVDEAVRDHLAELQGVSRGTGELKV